MAGTTEYKNQWLKEKNDRIYLVVPKGKKEQIKAFAESNKESINGFINRVINEALQKDNKTE